VRHVTFARYAGGVPQRNGALPSRAIAGASIAIVTAVSGWGRPFARSAPIV